MKILGISAWYHDAAACLVDGGRIVAAAEEERFSRVKHDARFPRNAVEFVLRQGGIDARDVDLVAFYDKPVLKFSRILETFVSVAPRGFASWMHFAPTWLRDKLWIEGSIRRELGAAHGGRRDWAGRVIFAEHHESHAASAFYPSPFHEAAVLTIDGVGEWATTSIAHGRGRDLSLVKEIRFPHSLGLLYSAFTSWLGFKVNSGEYKVMGLAPYGEPKYADLILEKVIDLRPDGSFRLNLDCFGYLTGLRMTNRSFDRVFGRGPREPESRIEQFHMDVARSLQQVTEEVMLRLARHAMETTGSRNLCLAGGVALNCVGNGRILREAGVEGLWVQPAAGDSGGALGAAMTAWHRYVGGTRDTDGVTDRMNGSYLGPEYDDAEIARVLDDSDAPHTVLSWDEMPERVAELIAEGRTVGWFQGRAEFGPRALGARSILGDPRNADMQRRLNLQVKYRESFRPFAPSVLAERASEWFEIDRESPYMLLVAPVHPDKRRAPQASDAALRGLDRLKAVRSEIPAVTHVDQSARIQTVHRETNPLYWELLSAFERRTGCPVLVNTSFNVRGEPVVQSPADALRCFRRTQLDYLVMGRRLVARTALPQTAEPVEQGALALD